jgi:hypothetical protein
LLFKSKKFFNYFNAEDVFSKQQKRERKNRQAKERATHKRKSNNTRWRKEKINRLIAEE